MGVEVLKHKFLVLLGLAHEQPFRVYSHSRVDSDLVYTYTTIESTSGVFASGPASPPFSHTHLLRLRLPVNDFVYN